MRVEGWVSGLVAASVLSLPLVAGADPPMPAREPLRLVDRPLTHVQGTLKLYVALDYYVLSRSYTDDFLGTISFTSRVVLLRSGIEVGVIDDLTLGAQIPSLQLSPESEFGSPTIYGMLRFVRGAVEVGASLALSLPLEETSNVVLSTGLPVHIHAGRHVRIDTGGFLTLELDSGETRAGISLPLSLFVNPVDRVLLGAHTGLSFPTWYPGEHIEIPLGFSAGYTVGDRGAPFADLWIVFVWPFFLTSGHDVVSQPDIWQLSFVADIYFDLDF